MAPFTACSPNGDGIATFPTFAEAKAWLEDDCHSPLRMEGGWRKMPVPASWPPEKWAKMVFPNKKSWVMIVDRAEVA